MSNEISLQAKLGITVTAGTAANATTSKTVDCAKEVATLNGQFDHRSFSLSTSKAALPTGGVTLTAAYWVFVNNKDATNKALVYSRKDATPTDAQVAEIPPGGFFLTKMPAQSGGYPAIYIASDASTPIVETVVCDG